MSGYCLVCFAALHLCLFNYLATSAFHHVYVVARVPTRAPLGKAVMSTAKCVSVCGRQSRLRRRIRSTHRVQFLADQVIIDVDLLGFVYHWGLDVNSITVIRECRVRPPIFSPPNHPTTRFFDRDP